MRCADHEREHCDTCFPSRRLPVPEGRDTDSSPSTAEVRYYRDDMAERRPAPDGLDDVTDEVAALRDKLETARCEYTAENAEKDALRAERDQWKREAETANATVAEATRTFRAEVERMRPVVEQMGDALLHVVENPSDWMDESRGANVYEAAEAFEAYRAASSEQETTDA